MSNCEECTHPDICESHGCGTEQAREMRARRIEAEVTAKNLKHTCIVVNDWLAGGCDVHDIPRHHIAVLVTWTKASLPSVLLNTEVDRASGSGRTQS